jgi:putative ATPase
MEEEGYGADYRYDHDEAHAFSGQNYFPDGMERPTFYRPSPRGFEKEIEKRLSFWEKLRRQGEE